MRVLIAAAIFGISFGNYGCSKGAEIAVRPMAASPIAAEADANPFVDYTSKWVDVTTVGPQLTLQDTRTGLKWTNRRPDATWQGAIDHCRSLKYNGVTGWRLPTREELVATWTHFIVGALKVGWLTSSDLTGSFYWSSSSIIEGDFYDVGTAWSVNLVASAARENIKDITNPVVCVQ